MHAHLLVIRHPQNSHHPPYDVVPFTGTLLEKIIQCPSLNAQSLLNTICDSLICVSETCITLKGEPEKTVVRELSIPFLSVPSVTKMANDGGARTLLLWMNSSHECPHL